MSALKRHDLCLAIFLGPSYYRGARRLLGCKKGDHTIFDIIALVCLVKDLKVLSAMLKVPRHLFVSEALMDQAYTDGPLPIGE